MRAEMLERFVVAEEKAFVGGHRFHNVPSNRLRARLRQPIRQRVKVHDLFPPHQARETGFQQINLVLTDDQSGPRFQQSGQCRESGIRERSCHRAGTRKSSSNFWAIRGSGKTA